MSEPIYLQAGVNQLPTMADLVNGRREENIRILRAAEHTLGRELTHWQFEAALGYLIWNEFMSAGRGAGKKFTTDFVQAVLLMEPNGL